MARSMSRCAIIIKSLAILCVLHLFSSWTMAAKRGLSSYPYPQNPHNMNYNDKPELYEKISYAMKSVEDSQPQAERLTSDQPLNISLYPWNDHLGRVLNMEWSPAEVERKECKKVAPRYLGKIRSINTYDQCVVIFSREGCRGTYRVIKKGSPSHNRLSDICFHRRTTSVRPCQPGDD